MYFDNTTRNTKWPCSQIAHKAIHMKHILSNAEKEIVYGNDLNWAEISLVESVKTKSI